MDASRLTLTYAERAELSPSGLAKRLFTVMSGKESNLCVAIDETDPQKFLTLADALGPQIAVLKTHVDIIEGFTSKLTVDLDGLAREHDFLIFEDRKFADIGQTVKNQYTKGIFHMVEWAHIINAHGLPGPGIIAGLREEVSTYQLHDQRGLLLIAQMSTKENLIDDDYTRQVVELGRANPDFVIGFIGAGLSDLPTLVPQTPPEFLIFSPGIKLVGTGDTLGQQYFPPDKMVAAGADVLIVGRDIFEDPRPVAKAKQYREAGWEAYQRRIAAPKAGKSK